jgi:hypothetical protein
VAGQDGSKKIEKFGRITTEELDNITQQEKRIYGTQYCGR